MDVLGGDHAGDHASARADADHSALTVERVSRAQAQSRWESASFLR